MSGTNELPTKISPAGPNGVTDYINNSSNVPGSAGKEVAQTIASESLSFAVENTIKFGGEAVVGKGLGGAVGGTAGAFIEPAIWVLQDQPVPKEDKIKWAVTAAPGVAAGPFGMVAGAVTGVFKGVIDGMEDDYVNQARAREPEARRDFIRSVRFWDAGGSELVARSIAEHGGVAWRVSRAATWVYIADATGKLVCDYKPSFSYEIYKPDLPLRFTGRDTRGMRFMWRPHPGTHMG
ncbi:hypothetical protein [Falsiroseomonas oryziterrae]|uniref:hypothetical protein n=1 Tax=Falsiroseomonas oryziterrae TaxID=2911368 RepID=UPI001F3D0101|nr:hypothetical protein [Roseomonas sp. NPKOSM-4]